MGRKWQLDIVERVQICGSRLLNTSSSICSAIIRGPAISTPVATLSSQVNGQKYAFLNRVAQSTGN